MNKRRRKQKRIINFTAQHSLEAEWKCLDRKPEAMKNGPPATCKPRSLLVTEFVVFKDVMFLDVPVKPEYCRLFLLVIQLSVLSIHTILNKCLRGDEWLAENKKFTWDTESPGLYHSIVDKV